MFAAISAAGKYAVNSTTECFKCGTAKRTGQRSCCARTGAWFKNCGDASDTKFDHTWADGIQACKKYVGAVSAEMPIQAILRHAGNIDYPIATLRSENRSRQEAYIYPPNSIFDSSTWNFRDCVRLTTVVVCICVFCIASHVHL